MHRLGALMIVALCALGSAPSATAEPAISAVAPTRQLLYPESSFYPRLIRLQHSGAANGTIVASVNTLQQHGAIMASTDGGKTFQQRGTVTDPMAAKGGQLCCSALFELPTAIGNLPAGTLLWADTVFFDLFEVVLRHVEQRLWASTDHGANWKFVSTIAESNSVYSPTDWGPILPSAWEPSLSMAADGQLVALYSDETDNLRHSQKLVQVRSPDAVHWVNQSDTVVSDVRTVRPGMANVITLPDGTYFMSYEICNTDRIHQCLAYFRRSTDGWNYGDPRFLGTMVRTGADGGYTQHAPFPAWSPGPGPNGTILLSGQMVSSVDGTMTANTGRTILANDTLGEGRWYEIPAPVTIDDITDAPCKNYSSALLPAPDGNSVLEAATDLDGDGACLAYYASGPLNGPAVPDK
ncbi:sialidase family protein [Nocardia sp. NPDC049149]|uniref:sialidase family protein n=1 Tax=Nocardia sp. NPDC049149 TaxID=3364315 RepID=UPI0037160870